MSTWRRARSIVMRQVMVPCASSWFTHPGSLGKSPRARMLGGRGLYLLKLVPRILVQARCSSTSCILVRVSTYRNNVKRMMGWVILSHPDNFPLLQHHTALWSPFYKDHWVPPLICLTHFYPTELALGNATPTKQPQVNFQPHISFLKQNSLLYLSKASVIIQDLSFNS